MSEVPALLPGNIGLHSGLAVIPQHLDFDDRLNLGRNGQVVRVQEVSPKLLGFCQREILGEFFYISPECRNQRVPIALPVLLYLHAEFEPVIEFLLALVGLLFQLLCCFFTATHTDSCTIQWRGRCTVVSRKPIAVFDTSVINLLTKEKEFPALAAGLTAAYSIRITGSNISELVATTESEKESGS